MKKIGLIILTAVVASALLISQVIAMPALASTSTDGGIITANGKATITTTPDVAWVSIGVLSTKATVELAQQETTKSTNAILATLKQLGIKEEQIKTINFSIQPNYEWKEGVSEQKLLGYTVNHQLEVKITAIQQSGKVLDQVVKAGGNSVSGIRFGLSDESGLYAKALELAVADAKIKATAMGKGIGVVTIKPISIKEQSTYAVPYLTTSMAPKMADAASLETTIMKGDLQIQAEVIVEFKY